MPGNSAASPPVFSLWHLRHFPAFYCSTNTPVLLHFTDFYPAEDIRKRRRAVSCKDFALSFLHVSSLLLSTAAEHFPAEHEAMRLMSPICDSLSHPLPGGQCCLCLHGLKVLSERWCSGFQLLYPAPLLSACRAEEPSEHPVLGVMLVECAVALDLLGMPSSWNTRDCNGQSAVFSPAFAASGSGPILRPFNTCSLAFPSLLGKIRSATPPHLSRPALELLWAPQEQGRTLHFLEKSKFRKWIVLAGWVLCCWVVGFSPSSKWTTNFYRIQSYNNSYYGGGQLAAQELSLVHTLSSPWIVR